MKCLSIWDAECFRQNRAYCLRVSSNAYNPVRSCIFSSQFTKLFDKNPTHIRPLGLRLSGDLSDIGFTQKNILVTSVSSTPPWHLVTPTVDLSLSTLSKSVTSPEIYHSKFFDICEGLQDYTDGSKMNNLTAAAAVGRDVSKSLRINSQASIFTAELVALNLSLDIIRRSKRKKICHLLRFIIKSSGHK